MSVLRRIFHPLMPALATFLTAQIGLTVPVRSWGHTVIAIGLTLAVSSLSWTLMERPINRLKRHFA